MELGVTLDAADILEVAPASIELPGTADSPPEPPLPDLPEAEPSNALEVADILEIAPASLDIPGAGETPPSAPLAGLDVAAQPLLTESQPEPLQTPIEIVA